MRIFGSIALLFLLAAAIGFGLLEFVANRSASQELVRALARREHRISEQSGAGPARFAGKIKSAAAMANDPSDGAALAESANDPARQKLNDTRQSYLEAYRASLDLKFGLLFRRLRLAPLAEESLKDLLTQREANNLTVADAARAQGVSTDDPAIEALDDGLTAANKAAMVDLLGGSGERQVHAFLQEDPLLSFVDDFAGAAAAAGAAITAEQATDLLNVLNDASEHTASGRVVRNTVDRAAVAAQVMNRFTPAQLSVLQLLAAEQDARRQVNALVTKLNSGG